MSITENNTGYKRKDLLIHRMQEEDVTIQYTGENFKLPIYMFNKIYIHKHFEFTFLYVCFHSKLRFSMQTNTVYSTEIAIETVKIF